MKSFTSTEIQQALFQQSQEYYTWSAISNQLAYKNQMRQVAWIHFLYYKRNVQLWYYHLFHGIRRGA